MKRKLLSIALSLALAVTTVLSVTVVSFAGDDWWDEEETIETFSGKDCTSDSNASAAIDYLMNKYPDGGTWKGSGECWGFAEHINSYLAASNSYKTYKKLKNTKANFLKYCKGVKAGTHIRFSNKNYFDGGWSGHSVTLLKVSDEKVFWADNNFDRANTMHYYSGTVDDFCWMYGYQYITMIKKPTKYKTYKTPELSSAADDENGAVSLTWLRTSGASKYKVYRSYSKTGTYKLIKTTTAKSYQDKNQTIGKTAYYKVKAVKGKTTVSSNITTRTLRLQTPKVTGSNDEQGNICLHWEAVPRADKYSIYRSVDGGKERKIATVKELRYTDTKATDTTAYYRYRVKAICDARSAGNSKYSSYCYMERMLPAPTGLKGSITGGRLVLSWNAVPGASEYKIYYCAEKDGEYEYYDTAYETTYTDEYFDEDDAYEYEYMHGYYKVAASTGYTTGLWSEPIYL